MSTRVATMDAAFPALNALGLSAEQFAALAWSGALCAEDRGREKTYYRLRFRMGAEQHVRYVGNNQGLVDQVQRELMQLQAKRDSRREMCRSAQKARVKARDTKHL